MFHDDQNHCADCGKDLTIAVKLCLSEKVYCGTCIMKYQFFPVQINFNTLDGTESITYVGNTRYWEIYPLDYQI
jgi:hypothetical protein